MTEQQEIFVMSLLLKPFVLFVFLGLVACVRVVIARHLPDSKLKRWLLLPLSNRRGGSAHNGR